jgi:leader peptidase (prepilin peptidase)/N-methyltransferase
MPIKAYENIPILSYIFLKGRCSRCGTRISLRYPFVEIVTAIVFMSLYMKYGLTFNLLVYLVFGFFILTAGFTDLFTAFEKEEFECGVIPSVVLYLGIGLGVVLSFFSGLGVTGSLIGAIVGYLFLFIPGYLYKLFKGREGMGDGDMYLMGLIGSFLGIKSILPVVLFSSFVGALIGIVIITIYKDKSFPIPFGPFICLGALFYLFYGEALVDRYLQLLR